MKRQHILGVILLLGACCTWAVAAVADDVILSEPSKVDLEFMALQRQSLQDLAALKLGRQFQSEPEPDLALLQALLDQQIVRADQTRELQAMGVIMGDLLAEDLNMHWVIYEDRTGRSRALRYRDTDNYLFPITMIARRREVGNLTPVMEIYQKAHDIITANTPPLPFQ